MTHVERLVKIYTESRARLLKEIEKRVLWGRSTYAQEQLLRDIEREMKRLNLESYAWADDAIRAAYMRAAKSTYLTAKAFDSGIKTFAAFGGVHTRAVAILAHNAQKYLGITNNLIARQAQDRVRQIGIELISRKFGEGLTVQETRRALMERFTQENFYAVPWRNGKGSMRVDSYSELVARTTAREAAQTGIFNQSEALGHHLYKMTTHTPTCPVCASREGRVYRTADYPPGDPRNQFPHIREGFPRWPTYKTVHPNCSHSAHMWIWEQKSDEERQAALARAGEPFNHDPRGEKERLRYEAAQRANRERLRDRKQWERYQEVLGKDNVPKTLSAFRAMKKSGNENWESLQALYREINRDNSIIQAAKSPGGRHSGKYNDAQKWTDKSVERAAQSYKKTAQEHIDKINNPSKYDKNWDKKTTVEKQGLLDKWGKDYARNSELRIIMEKILEERGIDID